MMSTRTTWRSFSIGLAAVLLVGACGDDESEPTETSPGIANPASEFCVDQGGTVEMVDEAAGQVGYCNLPDGTRIEEWEYFRQETGSTQP
jgi:uncharacterized protein